MGLHWREATSSYNGNVAMVGSEDDMGKAKQEDCIRASESSFLALQHDGSGFGEPQPDQRDRNIARTRSAQPTSRPLANVTPRASGFEQPPALAAQLSQRPRPPRRELRSVTATPRSSQEDDECEETRRSLTATKGLGEETGDDVPLTM